MIESKDLMKNFNVFAYFGGSRPVSIWMACVRTMFESGLQIGTDMLNASGIGLAAKSSRLAFLNVAHDRQVTNFERKRSTAIDKSPPLWSLDLKCHLKINST